MSLFDFENYDTVRLGEHVCPLGQIWVQPNCLVAPCPGRCSPELSWPVLSSGPPCPTDTLWDAIAQSCQPITADQLSGQSRIPTAQDIYDDRQIPRTLGPAEREIVDETPTHIRVVHPFGEDAMDVPKLAGLIIGAWLLLKYATRHRK